MNSMIVFSHLRWDFVYQRPQQLLSRLSESYRIFFIEEPIHDSYQHLDISTPLTNLWVCRPHTVVDMRGFHDNQVASLRTLLDELTARFKILTPIAWLYTPMALPLLSGLQPKAVVYDCMDELSAFNNAPRQLLQREHALLKMADLVFTGGPSLFRAKQGRHPAVFCFPSSVEVGHFAKGKDTSLDADVQRTLSRPRLGFYGVIDERLDIDLVQLIATSHPEWEIVMVGPIVKIDPATLPQLPNIHYFGQQPYDALPQFLAGWDVCLLPFALNESTRFISPTKTLEYMAAGKPIVSTPVTDVVDLYGHIVGIGQGATFVELCENALSQTDEQQRQRAVTLTAIVDQTSWASTVKKMHELIESKVTLPSTADVRKETQKTGLMTRDAHRVVVIGAGPTGLSAAYHCGDDCLLIEQNASVGGWCRSIQDGGFTFDYAGHIMFSNDPYVHTMYDELLGENIHWQDREAWVYSNDVFTRYPFQGALYGLPPAVISECIVGAIEARVGPLKQIGKAGLRNGAGGSSASSCKAESITDCCADGIAESTTPLLQGLSSSGPPPRNFEEFIHQVWGRGIAKHFAVPYNRKLWAVPLSTMETSWLGGRVPMPDLSEMIEGALSPVPKPMGPNARFGYPLRGGFQALMNGFLDKLPGPLMLDTRVVRVLPTRHRVALADGSHQSYEQLISTMPLPVLIKMVADDAPVAVRQAASRLRHVSVRCVNLGIGRANLTEKHWIYYPGATVFHRIFVQGNASPHCNAEGGFGLTCEITYSPDKPLPYEGDDLMNRCIDDCIAVGLFHREDAIWVRNMVDMPYAYVVYDHERAKNVQIIREWAQQHDIVLAGRYSEWEYYNSDHAFIAGRDAAARTFAGRLEARKEKGASGDIGVAVAQS